MAIRGKKSADLVRRWNDWWWRKGF